MTDLYLSPHQTRDREPTQVENAIADVIERCYADGVTACDPIVAALDKSGVPSPDGKPWTVAAFQALMKKLGA
jgi:hypothetical protein